MLGMTTTFDPAPPSFRAPEQPQPIRPPRTPRSDNLMIFAVILSAMAVLAGAFGVGLGLRAVDEAGSGGGGAAAGAASTATVHLTEFALDPGSVAVVEGGTLAVHNDGAVPHNLAIEGTDLITPMLNAGETANLKLTGLAPGTYNLICQVAGHADAGMKGTLVVQAGDGAAATDGGHGGSAAPHAMTSDEMDVAMEKSIKAFPAKTQGVGAQELAPTLLADGTKLFELTAAIVKWETEPGKFVDAWTYNGTVPGPTLRANPGDKVRVVLKNQLPESTAIHFHGLLTPNAADGVTYITQPPVKAGTTFTYDFVAQSTPAVGMYHSHHNAVHQVPNGLAGTFIIGQLPVPAGVTVAQEQIMMVNDAGTIGYAINGKSFPATAPVVAKKGEWIQVHYLNEGVMAHPMHLHGMGQLVIAKDGFPLPQPYEADTVMVGPGERYTVLIHATEVGTWAWHCHILTHAESAEKGMFGMVTALVVA
jgi:FtsP/CotA-like multicopper oxidase with cupredoxin domain